ncbi:hypothetical protein IF650_06210 [Cellulosimicrobium terreum]|nr:hypothetical protein [Cellulosimicrobium terreum]
MTDPRPAPSVVIRGGTGPTVVDTAVVTARARVVHDVADVATDVAARCRVVRRAVAETGPATFVTPSYDAWDTSVLTAGTGTGLGQPWLPTWPPHVVRARDAVLVEIDGTAVLLDDCATRLRDVGDRMLQAVAVYDDAELAAAAAVEDLWLVTKGLGFGAVSPAFSVPGMPGIPAFLWPVGAVVVEQGVPFLLELAAGRRPDPQRLVTGTAAEHAAAVRWLSRWIGPLGGGTAVGDAASVLEPLERLRTHRDRYDDDPVVTRLETPDGFTLPDPTDTSGALGAVAALYDTEHLPGSVVSVQRIDKGGADAWVVAIPGTQLGEEDNVFSMTSNLVLMDSDVERRVQADGARAVLAAMADAGIAPGDDVLLVGHSQGGMIAATVAAASVGTYSVRHVVTAGSPVAGHALPAGVKGTHLETQGEAVSDLDGAENPQTPDRVTVVGELRDAQGRPLAKVPHSVHFHQEVLAEAATVGDRGLEENLADVEALLAGDRQEPQLYEARLVEKSDPEAQCRAEGLPWTGPGSDPFAPAGPGWVPPPPMSWTPSEQSWQLRRPGAGEGAGA